MEKRVRSAGLELRAKDDGLPELVGHAAVFGQEIELFSGFRERVAQGAFTKVLRSKPDVRALIDHEPSKILGRTKSGTLTLEQDDIGLRVRIMPPDTHLGRDLVESVKRGDIDQMSFGFTVSEESVQHAKDGSVLRTIEEIGELFDVSAVTYPAYDQTSIGVRSKFHDITEARDTYMASLLADAKALL